ncbi:MAG: TlpA family protein disulfide reductase [Verrucomicrobia bacterium]|nr:TlpA family protein disulfide reductase [Verrucomicrobiota bacterium]
MKKLIPPLIVGCLVLGSIFLIRGPESTLKPGDRLPPLPLAFLGDKPDLEKKPLLVEFWATWCPPCRKSIPHLNDLYARYHPQGLEVIGVTDEDEQTVRRFQQQLPMQYRVAINTPRSLYSRFGVDGIPQAFLVDRTGKVVWTGHPLELEDDDLQGILR